MVFWLYSFFKHYFYTFIQTFILLVQTIEFNKYLANYSIFNTDIKYTICGSYGLLNYFMCSKILCCRYSIQVLYLKFGVNNNIFCLLINHVLFFNFFLIFKYSIIHIRVSFRTWNVISDFSCKNKYDFKEINICCM